MDDEDCSTCKFEDIEPYKYPCSRCIRCGMTDLWKPKEAKEVIGNGS